MHGVFFLIILVVGNWYLTDRILCIFGRSIIAIISNEHRLVNAPVNGYINGRRDTGVVV